MTLFRREYDVKTMEEITVFQCIYRKDGHVIVLDRGEAPPQGYIEAAIEDINDEESS